MPGSHPNARPLLLDCDTGIDDTLALAYLLTDPGTDLVAITTVSGNTAAAQAAQNTLDLLSMAGRPDVPVAVGAHDPLRGSFAGGAPHVHGGNGVADVVLPRAATEPLEVPGAELIVRTAREHAGRLHLLAIGPMTNLALALMMEPSLPDLVAELTVMAGAALVPGNITPVAEANVHKDPEAARAVLEAGWPITMVTMDASMPQRFEESDRQRLLTEGGPVARAAAEMLATYFSFYEPLLGRRCAPIHDPLAAAVATRTVGLALAPVVGVEVDTGDGPGRGQVICDLRGIHVGFPPQPGARVRVVLGTEGRFADQLVESVLPI